MKQPRVIFLSGPKQGEVYAIDQDEISIGRDEENSIVLNHGSVSRKHGRMDRSEHEITLLDLESKNGTFVNGVPVRSVVLEHGNEIRIGNTRMLFLERDSEPVTLVDEEPAVEQSTLFLRQEDLLYVQPAHRGNAIAERLAQLLGIAKNLSRIGSLPELPDVLFPALFAALPCRRAAMVLGSSPTDIQKRWFSIRDVRNNPEFALSRTVLQQAMIDHNFVLYGVVLPDSAPSLIADGARSVICVPLLRKDEAIGALYLDAEDERNGLNEEHLQFAAAAAGVASLAVENLSRLEALREENRNLRQEAFTATGMVGDSSAMRPVYDFIRKVSAADSTVLITGESGTGKELVARAIHEAGARAAAPFVAVNCAALTESLLESELFGHEKGAFTGAVQQHKGKFERAEGGTLFLDEVFELTPAIQAKLLRVLQEREFERVGGSRSIRVNVRVIAATHRDLKEEARKGAFREDLFYRLNVLSIRIPPLRERSEDIPLLAAHFLSRSCERLHRTSPALSDEARECLVRYSWPGNVRELENAIERAVVLSESGSIDPEDLPEALTEIAAEEGVKLARYHEAVSETKARVILDAIQAASGNLTEAAKKLGVNSNYLHRLIRNLNLRSRIQKDK